MSGAFLAHICFALHFGTSPQLAYWLTFHISTLSAAMSCPVAAQLQLQGPCVDVPFETFHLQHWIIHVTSFNSTTFWLNSLYHVPRQICYFFANVS